MSSQIADGMPFTTDAPRSFYERMRWPLMIGGGLVVLLVALILWLMGGRYESTDDAYVQARARRSAATSPGRWSKSRCTTTSACIAATCCSG